ncbi:MAG: NTP transferase domain-containing protein [Candidatus Peribacteraceae bacterium]|nr:NTP transferase domain-containing protein [Candidatus Peribacteraceae bacterium]
MIAILIVAGRSKRFWPLSEKTLFPVAGTTLIEEQVKRLQAAGLKEIVIVGGEHNKADFEEMFPKLKILQQEDLDLGMRGALLSSLPHCGEKPVMIVSGNDVIDVSAYKGLLKQSKNLSRGGLLLARRVTQYFPGGYLTVKGKRITDIVEKPGAGNEPSDLVNIVAHVHVSGRELLAALKKVKTTKDDGYEVALQAMLESHPYEAVPYEGVWQPVKFPWHMLSLLSILLPQNTKPVIDKTAKIHTTAVIEGAVVIGKNVKVFAHATVMGPCVIGEGTIIANNALVRGSSVGKHCVIGYNTEVARSVIADDVWTHTSYLGDSIVGSNVSLGAGTTTGNLRLDESEISSVVSGESVSTGLGKFGVVIGAGCRTGIHTCFLPGVKIGAGSFTNSATLVTGDIPDGSFVKMENAGKMIIRENTAAATDPTSREGMRKKLS